MDAIVISNRWHDEGEKNDKENHRLNFNGFHGSSDFSTHKRSAHDEGAKIAELFSFNYLINLTFVLTQ